VLKLSDVLGAWTPADRSVAEPLALLEAGWDEIVGIEVGRNSHPNRIADGTLTITTCSSAWSQQLSFLSDHVVRAVAARLPNCGIVRLRFRVGRVNKRRTPVRRPRAALRANPPAADQRDRPADAAEALRRFRNDVEARHRAQRSQGWGECEGCGALVAPAESLCATCETARRQERGAATARLLFEAPWLGCAGTIALVDGLEGEEYERIRSQVLTHWWGLLARARGEKRLSRDGRERLVAGSYVLLKSRLSPEKILPETVRSILGDELHDLLYGEV
jgi:hypothetical protein